MPEDKPHKRPPVEPDEHAADAELLFRDSAGKSASPGEAGCSAPQNQARVKNSTWLMLRNGRPTGRRRSSLLRPAQTPGGAGERRASQRRQARSGSKAPARQVAADPSSLVEETWSRWAEWGSNLLVVGGWMAVLLLLVYFVFGQEHYVLAFMLLIVGSGVAVVLSYPMLITLERPVRVTPEQAVRDYYNALSHHVPHLRRMWLLLSTAGRVSTAFGSFEGFKGYWREQLARLRQGHAGPLTPLVFEIVNFKSEKSAGKARIDATFGLSIFVRGRRPAGAIHTIPASICSGARA